MPDWWISSTWVTPESDDDDVDDNDDNDDDGGINGCICNDGDC